MNRCCLFLGLEGGTVQTASYIEDETALKLRE